MNSASEGEGHGVRGGEGTSGGGGGGAGVTAVRGHNDALVLDLLRGAGPDGISRLEIAERTGLTPQAVSKITARLRGVGLVAEAGQRASTGGKPRTVLRLVPEAGRAVGLHLDRDSLTAVLVDLSGALIAERRAPLDFGAGGEAVVEAAAAEVAGLLGEGGAGEMAGRPGGLGEVRSEGHGDGAGRPGVLGVGVALPGPLDHRQGMLHRVTGFPEWDGFPLRKALRRRLGLPVVVDKDTNAAALGLALAGATVSPRGSFAYLHLGTGLGAGLVLGGSVYRGERTGAGEFGHQVLQLDGPACECGNRGCVEALCLAAVGRGAIDEAARVLGEGAANLVSLLDIDLVLLGGQAIAAAPQRFVRGVGAVVDERARRGGAIAGVPVRMAGGAERVVADGAAQLLLAPLFGRANVAFPANRN